MKKSEFLNELMDGLKKFNHDDVLEVVQYYDEMICDKMDGGMSEEEAVASFGSIDSVIRGAKGEMLQSSKKTNVFTSMQIILITCFSPILFPIAICAVVLYFAFFAVWISLSLGFGVAAIAMPIVGFASLIWQIAVGGNVMLGVGYLGVLLACGALFGMLTYGIWKGGLKALRGLNKAIGKAISKLNAKKENK